MTLRWLARGMADVPVTAEWLSPAETSRLGELRFPKRRTELRLSRWTAKVAIARVLGPAASEASQPNTRLAGIEIRPAPDGAPTPLLDGAPAPVSVSLTDRADWAVCLVGPPGLAVGCDLELVEPREAVFVRDWFTPREQALVAAGEHDLLANLIWSAKESALKVLRTGLRRATLSVVVDLDAAATGAEWAPLTVRPVEGAVLAGWWRRYGDFVLTTAADQRGGCRVRVRRGRPA
ncbi:4'-phosphopantetheinyl transferase family protein [Actinophytocola sp.]|uniref:4'-phosphopantetheinyl transferase family protein n=1 Tax=Actinophytocola sp. TaxID=1872138 RepID=UPI00389A49E2